MSYSRPRTIHLVGDSFMRGYALGRFSDQLSTSNALWGFAAPDNMANLVLRENGVAIRAIGGLEGLPIADMTSSGLAAALASYITTFPVYPEDFIVVQDAGVHNSNPPVYQSVLRTILQTAASVRHRLCMTTFDYPADHGLGSSYEWDTAFSGKTMNEAIKAGAAAEGVPCLDMNAIMDAYRTATLAADGVNPMIRTDGGNDGIHPGPWGQLKMTGAILAALGLTPAIRTIASLTDLAVANYALLASGSGAWNSTKAGTYCGAIYG